MNAMDNQVFKFVKEFKKATAAGKTLNAREIAGKLLLENGFDPFDVESSAPKAAKAAAAIAMDPEAKAILDRVVERYPRQTVPAAAGVSQVASPAPAVGTVKAAS